MAAAAAAATEMAEERLAAEAVARAGAARCAAEVAAARAAAARVAAVQYLDSRKTSEARLNVMKAQRAARSAAEAVPWPCYQGPASYRAAAQAKVRALYAPKAAAGVALEAKAEAKAEVVGAVAMAVAEQTEAQQLHEQQWAQYYRQRSLSAESEAESEAEVAAAEIAAAKVATALGVRWEGAAREAEVSRAEAAGLREQLQLEQLQRGRQVEALEVELVAGRGALATAQELVLVVAEAQQEAKVAHGRETAATTKMTEIESRLAAAVQEGSAVTSLRVKVESMSRMLEEQQQELDDSYRRAAAVKLKTAMGGRAGLVLAHALERWRWACALLPAEQQSANGEVAERAALGQQVEALELKLVAGWRALATAKEAIAVAQQEAKVAHGRETAATTKMTEIESRLAAAVQEGSAVTSLRVRVESMSRMLEEQQQELDDSYRRAAAVKLGGMAGCCAGSALAHALERWRWACAQELQREQLQRGQLQREQLQTEQEVKLREELGVALARAAAAEAAVTAAEGSASLLLTTARAEAVAEARAEAVAVAHQAHQVSQCHPTPRFIHPLLTESDPYSYPQPYCILPTRLR